MSYENERYEGEQRGEGHHKHHHRVSQPQHPSDVEKVLVLAVPVAVLANAT
jgi:hypothetical protein